MEELREMSKILSHDSRYLGTRHLSPKTRTALTLNQSAQSLDDDDDVDEAGDDDYYTDDNDEENYDDGDDDDECGSHIAFGKFKLKISALMSTIFRYLVVFLSPSGKSYYLKLDQQHSLPSFTQQS